MTRSTASRLVDDLIEGGLVQESDPIQGLRGRPGVPLTAARGTVAALGLQINAARFGARLVDLAGEVLAESVDEHMPMNCGPDEALVEIKAQVDAVLAAVPAGMDLVGAALSLPGVVDIVSKRVLVAPHLGWEDLDLERFTAEVLPGVPVQVRSEAHHAARAIVEPRPGRSGEVQDALVVYGDIGLGAALILDGAARGVGHGFAGGLGHVVHHPEGPQCPCGSRGCLEQYAGRLALVRRAGLQPLATIADLVNLAEGGHEEALVAIAEAGEALGTVLASALAVIDSNTIVLAGELSRLSDLVAPHLADALRAQGVGAGRSEVVVLRAEDDLVSLTGAAVSMLHPVVEGPARYLDLKHDTAGGPGPGTATGG